MPVLPKQPLIYEINTWIWLAELSRRNMISISPSVAFQSTLRERSHHRKKPDACERQEFY
jgi:hypothetical protein